MENFDKKNFAWYMEEKPMETFLPDTSSRQRETAITGLAIVGFITLVASGIWLAVYSTRFVPPVVNGIGTAAVYLGSVFTPATDSALSVVPAPTTIFFGEASSTPLASSTAVSETATAPKTIKTIAGPETSGVFEIGVASSTTASLSGLPDLVVEITAVGYLTSASAGSFVASSTVRNGSRPAVRFTIKNIGTGMSGAWRFSASIPTQSFYIFQSQPQQSLAPSDSIEYTLGFDQAIAGKDKMISITANFDHVVAESNSNNNSDSTKVTIIGS